MSKEKHPDLMDVARWDAWVPSPQCDAAVESFRKGKRHGWHAKFYKDGQVACEGCFVDGKAEGWWAFFAEDGELALACEFKGGEPLAPCPAERTSRHTPAASASSVIDDDRRAPTRTTDLDAMSFI